MVPAPWSEADRRRMEEALALAARGAGRTSPNPMVGAILAAGDGRVIGRGHHERAGGPHAEVAALGEAGEAARGATLYVTLEPCAHQGRTPPCAPAIAEAGVSRVVAAAQDPNPLVNGAGMALLRERGVAAEVGLCAREAVRLNEGFFRWTKSGRPFVTLKAAASLDGRIALRTGESRWISGPESRAWAHVLRDRADAILAGVETVRKDDPLLTARPEGKEGKPLIRIVLDSLLTTPEEARVLPPDRGVATILAATEAAPEERAKRLEAAGAEVLRFPADPAGRVPLAPLLEELGRRGALHLLVEGGGRVHGSFLNEGLADKILFFLAPMIIGDQDAPGAVTGAGPPRLEEARRLEHMRYERIGEDLLVEGYLGPPLWAEYED